MVNKKVKKLQYGTIQGKESKDRLCIYCHVNTMETSEIARYKISLKTAESR